MSRLLSLALSLFLLVACGRVQNESLYPPASPDGLDIKVDVPDDLTLGAPAPLVVHLLEEGEPVGGARVSVEGAMSHAGMAPVLVAATERAAGDYHLTMEWTMAGEWLLIARATLPDGRSVERVVVGLEVRQP